MIDLDPIPLVSDANPVPDPAAEVDQAAKDRALAAILAAPVDRPPPRRAARRIPRLAAVAIAGLAAVVLGLTLQAGGRGQGTLPGVASALAAAAGAPGAVLHTIDDGPQAPSATSAPAVTRQETWASLDGAVRRTLTTRAGGSTEDLRVERRDGRYRVTVYRSDTGELYSAPWQDDPPAPPAGGPDLTVTSIRRYADVVAAGRARLDGETEIDGQPALRVVDTTDGPAGGAVWYVSRDTEDPALLRLEMPCRDKSGPCPPLRTTYSTFEISQTRDGLELPAYPGARDADAAQAAG